MNFIRLKLGSKAASTNFVPEFSIILLNKMEYGSKKHSWFHDAGVSMGRKRSSVSNDGSFFFKAS